MGGSVGTGAGRDSSSPRRRKPAKRPGVKQLHRKLAAAQAAREEKELGELGGVREPSGAAGIELLSPGASASGASPVAPAPEVTLTPPSRADQEIAGSSRGDDSSSSDDEAPAPTLTPEERKARLARFEKSSEAAAAAALADAEREEERTERKQRLKRSRSASASGRLENGPYSHWYPNDPNRQGQWVRDNTVRWRSDNRGPAYWRHVDMRSKRKMLWKFWMRLNSR